MSHDYHLEVAVAMDPATGQPYKPPDGGVCSIWAPYESAYLNVDNETVYDNDGEGWIEPDSEVSANADGYLINVLAFPAKVIDIFREWTGPNGYDINIMSCIADLLVKNGWVDENDPIINGEVESDGLIDGVPTSMLVLREVDEPDENVIDDHCPECGYYESECECEEADG